MLTNFCYTKSSKTYDELLSSWNCYCTFLAQYEFLATFDENSADYIVPHLFLRLMTTRIFLSYFSRDQNSQHFNEDFLQLMPLISALFYASKQLITQVSPIM